MTLLKCLIRFVNQAIRQKIKARSARNFGLNYLLGRGEAPLPQALI